MIRALARLLTLIAVLLMPFSMSTATAAPAAAHRSAVLPMEHCPDGATSHDKKGGFAECTMACSAALPAIDAARNERLLLVCMPAQPEVVQRLRGLEPETATPPPKRS